MPKPENIKPHEFKKGQSGNPKGRPRKIPALDTLMDKVMGEEKDGMSAMEAIIKSLRAKAAKGDIKAAQILLDRAYGRPKQHIDHTTKGEAINKPDLSKLTDAELRSIADLQRKSGIST